MRDVYVVIGPTAVGKSSFAFSLAREKDAEIVSADSVQVYKYLNIGSAKATESEQREITHHMIDIVNPDENFTAYDYQLKALESIDEILSRDKMPIIVGGTGLYVHSLLYDMDFANSKPDLELRKKLEKLTILELLDILRQKEIEVKEEEEKNRPRLIRLIEISNEKKSKDKIKKLNSFRKGYNFKIILLNRERQKLYDRINKRVDIMIEDGLVHECEMLIKKYRYKNSKALSSIGYKEIIAYIKGDTNFDEAISKIKQSSRNYAKRQITWFKKYKEAEIINLD